VHVHHPLVAIVVVAPDLLDQLLPAEHAADVAGQRVQNVELGAGQINWRGRTLDVQSWPDVSEAFPTDEAVNEALRLVLQIARLPSMQHSEPAPA